MKSPRVLAIATVIFALAGLTIGAGAQQAANQQDQSPGPGSGYMMGPGMMGPGMGYGMMGPGMMGPGMMGPGMMGPGMMGPGMGYGMMGPGMMGPGMMGPGMMGPGMMGPGMGYGMMGSGMMGHSMMRGAFGCPTCGLMGSAWGYIQPSINLSASDVKDYFERWTGRSGNPRLKVGNVVEKDADTITADIVTRENSLVQQFTVDRHTGFFRPAE